MTKLEKTRKINLKVEAFKLKLHDAMNLTTSERNAASNTYFACREIGVEKVRADKDFKKNKGFEAGVIEWEYSQALHSAGV